MNNKEDLKRKMELIPMDSKERIYLVQAMALIAWNEDLTNKVKEHFAKKIELGGNHATMKFETINQKEFISFVLCWFDENKQKLPNEQDETPEGEKETTSKKSKNTKK